MVRDWPGVTPPYNGFTRPRRVLERERQRQEERPRVGRIEMDRARERRYSPWQRERERERERERNGGCEGRAREREEGNGSHIDFPMFPCVVTIAPGEGARNRQVLPSSTVSPFF